MSAGVRSRSKSEFGQCERLRGMAERSIVEEEQYLHWGSLFAGEDQTFSPVSRTFPACGTHAIRVTGAATKERAHETAIYAARRIGLRASSFLRKPAREFQLTNRGRAAAVCFSLS